MLPKVVYDLATNKYRWKNALFGLAFLLDFHKSDYRKTKGEKTGCFDPN